MINKRSFLLAGAALAVPNITFAAEAIRVPLRRDSRGAPMVELDINGQGPFLFDLNVGSGISTIGRPLSNTLKLQLIGDAMQTYTVYVDGRELESLRVNAVKVSFGGAMTRHNQVFMRLPHGTDGTAHTNATGLDTLRMDNVGINIAGHSGLSSAPEPKKTPIMPRDGEYSDGMIGNALFLEKPSILDLAADEIRIYPDGNLPLDGFQPVTAKVSRSGVNTSAITLAGRLGNLNIMLAPQTSGMNGLLLSSAMVKKYGLWDKFPKYMEESRGDLGGWRVTRVQDFSIGPFKFGDVRVALSDPSKDDHMEDTDCFVGLDILSQFAIAFGTKSQIALKPNNAFTGTISGT